MSTGSWPAGHSGRGEASADIALGAELAAGSLSESCATTGILCGILEEHGVRRLPMTLCLLAESWKWRPQYVMHSQGPKHVITFSGVL